MGKTKAANGKDQVAKRRKTGSTDVEMETPSEELRFVDAELSAKLKEGWEKALAQESEPSKFPLVSRMYGMAEIEAMVDVILSNHITFGPKVDEFERLFAEALGVQYAVMVNSGSSANLLAMAALMNPKRERHLKPGDSVLIPCVCWSTSLFPIMQFGCNPVFVDVVPETCNIDLDDMRRKIKEHKPKAVFAVHIIGNACDMHEFMSICEENDMLVIEDTCESMGTFVNNPDGSKQCLGAFGEFGTFSMYFSHHITSGEGGVVICKTHEDYELLRCLRAHGWTRHLSDESRLAYEQKYSHVDPRFLFVNAGFNFRPMSIQGAMGIVQIKQLHKFNATRRDIHRQLREGVESDSRFQKQFTVVKPGPNVDPAWFGFSVILDPQYYHQYQEFVQYLTDKGIENRPVVSGNMTRQPVLDLYNIPIDSASFTGAERVHKGGLFLGIHNHPLAADIVSYAVDTLLSFEFKPRRIVLVTGGSGLVGTAVREMVKDSADEWIFMSSKDCDLRDPTATLTYFKGVTPTHVIHLAADVGGLYKNLSQQVQLLENNVLMNTSVIQAARAVGVKNLVACLSTCILPDGLVPVEESQMHAGAPHHSNEGYAHGKRVMEVNVRRIREQYGLDWFSVIPCNLYGPNDNFSLKDGHVISALIKKASIAKETGEKFVVYGSGKPLRQFVYSEDLARILVRYVEGDPVDVASLIIAPPEEVSIKTVADLVAKEFGITNMEYDTSKPDGQHRKTAKSAHFDKVFPDFKFTSIQEGIHKTVEWFKSNPHRS